VRWLPRTILCTLAALLGACFNPTYPDDLTCSPEGTCPPGQTCNMATQTCRDEAPGPDTLDGGGRVDAEPTGNCPTGFEDPDDDDVCTDIDECARGTDSCHPRASCTNTQGSFTCQCDPGFSGNGVLCSDIDECGAGFDDCDVYATCTNTLGSYACACNTGWTGDGRSCVDIDECVGGACDVHATCTNTPGSYTCACNAGWTGDGWSCVDTDECASGPCDVNATCTNTPGSYACACNGGWTGDGWSCVDIDECASAPCPVGSSCVNTPGGYSCTPPTGGCAHDICVTGDKLDAAACPPCVASICAADSYCCNTSWDSICVGEVSSICGLSCASCPAEPDPIVTIGAPVTSGSTTAAGNHSTPSCSSSSTAPEILHVLTFPGRLDSLSVNTFGSSYDTVLYLRSSCAAGAADLACSDDASGLQSEVILSNVNTATLYLYVDGFSGSVGAYTLNIAGVIGASEPCNPGQVSAGMFTCAVGTCTDPGSGFKCGP
jgi:hypothetical protein